MSSTPSTTPSSKLPFSNSVTGTGAVLLGPLASFHSGALRGRSAPMAERYDAATTAILAASCCCSGALSRATVLPSSCCVASPSLTPQPSSSVLAAFCPLTSEAWRSGTMRCGALADADTSSGEGSTTADNSLQSSLVLSSDWSQRGSLAAAHDTPLSPVSLSGQYLISTADDANHADDTENNGSSLSSERYTVRRLSAPKAFMPLYPVQSPAPFAPCFAFSPLSGDSLSTPPTAPALERETAGDSSTTPAVSSHLPSEPWQQHSLLMSPLLHSLPLPFVSPRLGCIAGSEEAQGQFSRHRTPVSAHFEHLARMSNEVKSRGLPATSLLIAAASPAKHKDDMLARLIAPPLQRRPLNPLSSDEGSCSPLFTALVSEDPAPLPRARRCSEGTRHRSANAKLTPISPSEVTRTEESFSGAGGTSTAGSPVEHLRCFSPPAEDVRSIELPPSMAKPPAQVDRALGFHPFPVLASGNGGKENQRGEDINRRISFAPPPPEDLHSVIAHCPSVEQLRASVNASPKSIQFNGRGTVPLQKRRFSLPQNLTLKIKRRGSV